MAGVIKIGVNFDKLKDFVNDKGYVNLTLFVDNEADQYDNNVTGIITQTKEQWENKLPKTYVGNGRVSSTKDNRMVAIEYKDKSNLGASTQSMAGRNVNTEGTDGLPF